MTIGLAANWERGTVREERWRAIPGYEGSYEVSNQGRVRSLQRIIQVPGGGVRKLPARLMALTPKRIAGDHSYLTATLSRNGHHTRLYVHRLVAAAFQGVPRQKAEVRHLDGDTHNNCLRNIRWKIRRPRPKPGKARGERHGQAKLTTSDVVEIWRRLRAGIPDFAISADFPVTTHAVRDIRKGRSWRWLTSAFAPL